MHLHAIQNQAGLTSYLQRKPSISQIMHLHVIQDQAELTIYLQRKTIDQPENVFIESSGTHLLFPAETIDQLDNAFTCDSGSSGTHFLFETENYRSA